MYFICRISAAKTSKLESDSVVTANREACFVLRVRCAQEPVVRGSGVSLLVARERVFPIGKINRHPEKRRWSAVQDLLPRFESQLVVGDSVSSSLRLMYGMTAG